VFYQYICIDRELLLANLNGDEALTGRALRALAEAALTVGPSGKQNSYASRAYAHFALAEKGSQQPRSLTLAFLHPVTGDDYGAAAARRLQELSANMDKVYGPCSENSLRFDVLQGEGSSHALLDFVAEA
jgi:CRISPR system Cascade subunit CasC